MINVVPGFGATAGAALAAHPDTDLTTFTGSTAVGASIQRVAADMTKRVALELGGKSALIICDDADCKFTFQC